MAMEAASAVTTGFNEPGYSYSYSVTPMIGPRSMRKSFRLSSGA
jgi:hypothetical protein